MKFSGTKLSWGGQALVKKQGRQSVGEDGQNFCCLGGHPQSPQGKKTLTMGVQKPLEPLALRLTMCQTPLKSSQYYYPLKEHVKL